jgi:hypothetical protein
MNFESENISDFIKAFEDGIDQKKIKRMKGIDLFIEEEKEESLPE